MDNLNKHSSRSEPLPLDTVAAVQLLDLFRDPDHDVDRIVELISQDPVLSAETLRRCNNVTFGTGERITDVFEAVNRLGYYEVYGIIEASLSAQAAAQARPGGGKPNPGSRAAGRASGAAM
jgi:HD-like signal output (HDOD) protein